MEEARALVGFINGIAFEDFPIEVTDKAKELILDQLGCQLSGSTLPWSKITYEYIRDNAGPSGESTIVKYGLKTIAQDAAFANANFGNGIMADDTDSVCHGHLGSIIIPAALAVGEREGATGKEFIRAVIVGYDVASRIGAASPLVVRRGFHPGSILGTFGAAASASILLGLDERQALNALAIAGSHSSGLMEYARSGGSVNRLHAGMAAQGGIRAALLAQRGFSGPATILEGERGFLHAFSGEYLLNEITQGLGQEFRILLTDLRSHCCCGTQHAGLDAVSTITGKHTIYPSEIEKIIIGTTSSALRTVSKVIVPKDITSAQFSGRFGIALRMIKGGNGIGDYTEKNVRDPEILKLVEKIHYVLDEDLERIPSSDNPARVTITLSGSTVYEETVPAPRGSIKNPMTREELLRKFREFASMVVPEQQIETLIKTVKNLNDIDNIRELIQLLVPV
ncbi:MmgE/PrpD family protein [bacterium]|nr:MmgE/PrpD family protein [bacterium]